MSIILFAKTAAAMVRITAPTAVEGVLRRGKPPERYDARLADWSARMLEIADIDLSVEGRENLGEGEAFVVMSNHQSHFDIPVLFQSLKRRVRMVGKTELFHIPAFGQAMRVAGFVEVDRGNRNQAVHALEGAAKAISEGTNIWIAPEGTRSESGKFGKFKKGGFHLAIDAGARILPVSIDGTKNVLAAHSKAIQPGQSVRVVVGEPIDSQTYGKERLGELLEAVRSAIAMHIPYA